MAMTRNRALSLIEVVLAIIILGLAVPPLMIQLNTAVTAQVSATVQMTSAQLVSERLGEIQAACTDTSRGYATIDATNYPTESNAAGIIGYTRQTKIREVSTADYTTAAPGSGVKRIRVTVSDPRGNPLVAETFVCDPASGGGSYSSGDGGGDDGGSDTEGTPPDDGGEDGDGGDGFIPPGHGSDPPGQGGTPPGQSGETPGTGATPPGQNNNNGNGGNGNGNGNNGDNGNHGNGNNGNGGGNSAGGGNSQAGAPDNGDDPPNSDPNQAEDDSGSGGGSWLDYLFELLRRLFG